MCHKAVRPADVRKRGTDHGEFGTHHGVLLADVVDEVVETRLADLADDERSAGSCGHGQRERFCRFVFPSDAARTPDEVHGPFSPLRKRRVRDGVFLVLDAQIAMRVGEDEVDERREKVP